MSFSSVIFSLFVAVAVAEWHQDSTNAGPSQRFDHSFTAVGSNFFMFGGQDSNWNCVGDSWLFTGQINPNRGTWTALTNVAATSSGRDIPSGRRDHYTVALSSSCLLVFGGADNAGTPLNDLYKVCISGSNAVWTQLQGASPANSVPAGRYAHSTFIYNNRLYVSDGALNAAGDPLGDLWYIPLNSLTHANAWVRVNQQGAAIPAARYWHSANVVGNKLYVVAGYTNVAGLTPCGAFQDFWIFNLDTNTWTKGSLPANFFPRSGQADASDSSHVYIFSGEGLDASAACNVTVLNDLWSYNVATGNWNQVNSGRYNAPATRLGSHMDFSSGRLYAFGGIQVDGYWNVIQFLNDVWDFTFDN